LSETIQVSQYQKVKPI